MSYKGDTENLTLTLNGDKTLSTIGGADVTALRLKDGAGKKLGFAFPLNYNVGSVGTYNIPEATRTVKIKVSAASDTAIFVDYLFDMADLNTTNKWVIYDPTVTEGEPAGGADTSTSSTSASFASSTTAGSDSGMINAAVYPKGGPASVMLLLVLWC